MTHLLIRADSNRGSGTGHVMRCLALAQAWRMQGGRATFISNCESQGLQDRIQAAGIRYVALSHQHPNPADLKTTLDYLRRIRDESRPDGSGNAEDAWLVLDGYHFDAEYQQAVRDAGHSVFVIDDTAHLRRYHAGVLLNQNIGAEHLEYRCDPDTRLLLGTGYALLRSEFLAWRRWRREIPAVARKVLVTLGGADPDNVTLKVVRALQGAEVADLEAKVVVGPANPHLETLKRAATHFSNNRIRLLTNVTDMSALMAWADVGVYAGGSTCWEMAYMGVPGLVIVLAENQKGIASGLDKEGAAVNLGWHEAIGHVSISTKLSKLLNGRDYRKAIAGRGRSLVDGNGCDRVLKALVTRIAPEPFWR